MGAECLIELSRIDLDELSRVETQSKYRNITA